MDIQEECAELTKLMCRCGHALRRGHGGKVSQETVIRLLHIDGAMTQRELQERMRVQQSSVSELVKKLEDQGLVSKERDPRDRRKTILRLTEAGERQDATNKQKNRARDQRMFGMLDDHERAELTALLQKLLKSWDEMREQRH